MKKFKLTLTFFLVLLLLSFLFNYNYISNQVNLVFGMRQDNLTTQSKFILAFKKIDILTEMCVFVSSFFLVFIFNC